MSQSSTGIAGTGNSGDYVVIERGPNHRVWRRITSLTNEMGEVSLETNGGYTELATGLHHLVAGQWVESSDEIQITPEGGIAANAQHQVAFAANINTVGAIHLTTPDGKHLRSHILGLSYFDPTTGQYVLIAQLKDSIGQVVGAGSNQVIYADAFNGGFKADVLYHNTKAGFEQDIVLREQPPSPAAFGLNPATTRLQVTTEFLNPPVPRVAQMKISDGTISDQFIDFGQMSIGQGHAFSMGNDSGSSISEVPVNKRWLQLNNRRVLVEDVPIPTIAPGLSDLPTPSTGSGTKEGADARGLLHRVFAELQLPPGPKLASHPNTTMKMAAISASEKGFVLDYNTINSGQTNYTFQGDTTYYISGSVTFRGTNTFEGGAVLKFATNGGLNLQPPNGQIVWLAGPYRPVIFTAVDDDSVGEAIGGSTGNPTGYYANPALGMAGLSGTPTIAYFRIAYAKQAILLSGTGVPTFYHGQIVNCQNGLTATGTGSYFRNVLFASVLTNFNNIGQENVDLQNSTLAGSAYLASFNNTFGTLALANCILANITNLSTPSSNAFSGSFNGFYNCTELGTSPVTNTLYPFQSVAAGSYYLTNGTTFTNAGTTSIDATLLASLQQKTTFPPIIYSNVTVSVNTTLSPQAQRDTDTPDLGYHYDPIDYLVDSYGITNATFTVTNGTAIACYNDNAGLWLQGGGGIVSVGTPLAPNWFTRYTSVQEQPVGIGSNLTSGIIVNASHGAAAAPNGTFRFSKFTSSGGTVGYHLYHSTTFSFTNLLVQDCEFWNSQVKIDGTTNTTAVFINNLFRRCKISGSASATTSCALSLTNNLIWSANVLLAGPTNNIWQAYNNAFDSCASVNGLHFTNSNGNNAYLNTGGRINPTNGTEVISSSTMAYLPGPLGGFYQPTNSPLINMGSTNANLLGLYHYTTQTNEVKETNSLVDIGYHYVAVDGSGNPMDTDSDGVPDYQEDANGNGSVDSGETDWQDPNDLGLRVLITRPKNNSIIP